jgi:hypothetical protein
VKLWWQSQESSFSWGPAYGSRSSSGRLGEVPRHPTSLVLGQQLGGGAALRLIVEVEIAERLALASRTTNKGGL